MKNNIMDENTKASLWVTITIALILSVIACCVGLVPQTIYTNTAADEAKIEELIINELKNDGIAYQQSRSRVLDTFYATETQDGWSRTSVKILFLFSALPASIFVLILIADFWGRLGIGRYFKTKTEQEMARTKAYEKTLNEFIRVQEKINKDIGIE